MRVFVLIFLGFLVASCAGGGGLSRQSTADQIAASGGLSPILFNSQPFKLHGYARYHKPGAPLYIYIEGDGLAYITRNRISSNPTPKNPTALRLAAVDRHDNVLYLARPCQYVNLSQERLCGKKYWTTGRFAPEVISATNEAIDIAVIQAKASGINIAGFSGGGAVAALIAAQRSDILSLKSFASPLDTDGLMDYHRVPRLKDSLNPLDQADKLKDIPQEVYLGSKDKLINRASIQAYLNRFSKQAEFKLVQVKGMTHNGDWGKYWAGEQ